MARGPEVAQACFKGCNVISLSSIVGQSQIFTWSSFLKVVEECPNPLSEDGLHFEYPEMSIGVNVIIISLPIRKTDLRPVSWQRQNSLVD